MNRSQAKDALRLARKGMTFTAREAAEEGIHSQILTRLVREGSIERIARAQYRLSEQPVTEHHTLAIAARAVPDGVVCLLSALSLHGIGSELPAQVWLAIDRRARRPSLHYPPLRIVRFSGKAFTEGVEIYRVERWPVKVYSVAKTLVDLFKYRNKIGLDVALVALREAWRERRFTMDDMDRYARICRVHYVMAPYLEALVA